MPATESTTLPVLVVGATGSLESKVVDELLERGKNVRALVRPAGDAGRLESRGVQIARGDMLDVDSLVAAMNGTDAVITTAAGYTRGGKNANDIDTIGNANLAEAAHRTGIRRFVLTSILTSDQTPDVPHFWHKKLAEDKLEQLGVPFVASITPGRYLDKRHWISLGPGRGITKRLINDAVEHSYDLVVDGLPQSERPPRAPGPDAAAR